MLLLGIFEINEAKRLSELFSEKGIGSELRNNEETCKKGCRVVVEVWVEEARAEEVVAVLKQEAVKVLNNEGLEPDPAILNEVYDPDQETAVCPACGAAFSTSRKECPECGLVFVGE
ncbi:MAG: hypothetical protein JXA66_03910 [Oligoflexia bacterium]|nr:hypothetical protein [Oligoflexia bacterium]